MKNYFIVCVLQRERIISLLKGTDCGNAKCATPMKNLKPATILTKIYTSSVALLPSILASLYNNTVIATAKG